LTGYNHSKDVYLTCYSYSNTLLLKGYNRSELMLKHLAIRQLDQSLLSWRSINRSRPTHGWLKAIREALGMTTRQLAQAVGVSQGAVVDIERSEARDDITLASLRRYAAAIDCELVYALVPKKPLHEILEDRADRVAREQVARVSQSMSLEDQATSTDHQEREIADLRRKLLEGKRSRLWQ
jgi:predicted DNA-binding mobile mystery protein A